MAEVKVWLASHLRGFTGMPRAIGSVVPIGKGQRQPRNGYLYRHPSLRARHGELAATPDRYLYQAAKLGIASF